MMNKERLEYLVNEMYYNYLEQNEAQELIDYIKDLEQRINDAKDVVKEIKLHYQQHPTMIPSVKIDRLDKILGGKE